MAGHQAVNIAGRDALPGDYRDFASRYRKQVRAEYQSEVENFKRFAYETGEAEQKLAQESLAKLEGLSLVLKSFPEASKSERFEDQKMVREFYQLRVQYNEAQGTMVYVGVLPKEPEKLDDATSVASLAKDVFLGPTGLGQVVKPVTDVFEKAQADAKQAEEHSAHLKSIGYAGKKGTYQAELDALDAEMKGLREDLLANLEPKDKCVDPKAQLSQIRLVIQIDLELGLLDYDHIVRDFEAWERIVDQNAEVFARNPQLFLENWNATWELNLKIPTTQVAGGVFEPQEAILKKMKGIVRDPEFQKNLRANYEKTAGPAWDQAAFDQLLRQFDEGFDVTKLKLLTPYISEQGLKLYFSKNQQAKALEKRYDESTLHVDPAGDLEAGLQALKLYAELGNEPKVSQLIEQFRNDAQQSIHVREVHEVLGNIELLHLNQQMAFALRGTDLRPKPGEETYENQVLNDARRLARSLQGDCFVVSTEEVQGLVAARAFFESDRDSLNVAEVDKKLKEGRDYLEAAIESQVRLLESSTEREMRSYGPEFSLYKPEERQATLRQNAALVEADLALMGTQDLSKPEVRKEVGRKLLEHLDFWRRNLEANPDLPLEFRIEQYRQMAATTALFNKNFTTGDDPIMHKVEPAVSDEVKNTREWQHSQAGAPPNLETQTKAVAELGKALIEENSYAFYHQLPENMHYIVTTIHSHGLSGRIEEGIVGYYMKRAEDAALLGIKVEESHYKPITEKEWQKIDEIRTLYQGSGLTQETMIQQYLIEIGKFEPIDDGVKATRAKIQADYQLRFDEALKNGDVDFISVMSGASFHAFAQVDVQAHQKLADSRNADLPLDKRFEAGMEAAGMFGQLGLEARMDESLAPIVAHVETQDAAQRAGDYLILSQIYENSGMDASAKKYLQKIADLDPGAKPETKADQALHETAVMARAKIQMIDGNLDEAKKLLSEIQGNPVAKQFLAGIDGIQYQQRVGYPMEFLSGLLMAEVDKRYGPNRDSAEYLLSGKMEEANKFREEAQAFLTEAQRLCESGECRTLQEAIDKLRGDSRYVSVFVLLESTGRGQDTMAYIKTMANPALSDVQMAGETLKLAEKLLSREDFDFAMNIAAGLMDDPFVSKQAKELVKNRIPDAAKWKAQKDAIWKAVKDILIVPAIIEGRYGDAFVSAITTIGSFGVGRIFSAGAKIGWAAMTARGVARAGWAARIAGSAGFRMTGFVFVAMADNAGFAVGSMLMESAVTGTNRFSMDRFWHEMLVGIAPFALVHGSGKLMSVIGKRAEHIPWFKVAGQAEAALLKSQGKFVVNRAGQVGLWTGHRLLNASAFTLGGIINKKTGLLEDDNAPLGLMFLQNLAMDLQMLAAHKGVNALTGGRMDAMDRKADQKMYLAASMAKLHIPGKHPAAEAMVAFLPHYADALAQKRGKPLSSNELAKEVGNLNDGILELLKIGGMTRGDGFEAARMQWFLHAAKENLSGKDLKEFAKQMGEVSGLDRVAADLLPKDGFSKSDRDALNGHLMLWAMSRWKDPALARKKMQEMVDLSPKIAEKLNVAIDGILGPGGSKTVAGQRLREAFLGRALEAGKDPAQVLTLLDGAANQGPFLGSSMDTLLAANNITDPAAKLHLVEWMMEKGFDLASFNYLLKEVGNGEVVLKFEGGKLFTERVPPDGQAAQRQAVQGALADHGLRVRGRDAVKLAQDLKLGGHLHSKQDRTAYTEMILRAAMEGKVPLGTAKELFLAVQPTLKKHIPATDLPAVEAAVFHEILSGNMSSDQAWALATRLANGDIALDVQGIGRMSVRYVPVPETAKPDVAGSRDRTVAAPDDSPTVTRPRGKEAPPTPTVGDGTQVGSGRGRRKPAADDGQDQAAAYAGDTRVDDKAASRAAGEPLAWKPTGDGGQEAKLGAGVLKTDKQGGLTLEFPGAKDPVSLQHNGRELRLESDDILQIRAGDTLEIDGFAYVRSGNELRPFTRPTPGKVLADGGNGKIFDNGDGSATKQGKTRKVMNADGTVREIDPATAFDNEQRALAFVQDMAAREPALADFAPLLIGRTGAGELVIGKVPGKTLENLSVAERKAIPEQAWKDFETALRLLGEAGLYHGDMNPQNVLWDGKKLRLIDFGNAQFKVADNNDMKRFQDMKADARSDRADFPIRSYTVSKGAGAIPDVPFEPAKAVGKGGEAVNPLHSEVDYLVNTDTPFTEMAKRYQERLKGLAKDSPEYQKALAEYKADRDRIATALVQEHSPALDKAEGSFLKYLQDLTGSQKVWDKIHGKYEFLNRPEGMEILPPHGRLKDPADVVSKLMRRGWKSMEPFTDLAATRVVVDSYTDVHSVIAAITDKYPIRLVRDANGQILKDGKGEPIRDWNRITRLVAGDKQWGYRAIHLAVEYTLPNGKKVPVEVQIMTRGNYEWGEIQHDLSYKNASLPKEVKDAANDHFVEVANYLAYLDQGVSHPERPQAPDMKLIPNYETLSADSKKEIQKSFDAMAELMDRYERVAAQKDGIVADEKSPAVRPDGRGKVIPLRPVAGDGTKVEGKGRKGQKPPPAETEDGYFEAAAFSGDPRGPVDSGPGRPMGSKGDDKGGKGPSDEPPVGLLLSADGLDGFSVRADQEKTLRWSSRDGKIPGEPWAVDIKPLGDGTFLLIPVEGTIRYHDGASYVEVPKKGLTLKSDRDLRLQLGDLDFQWRKPGAETGKSLVTGSRQAGEFLVGEIFDYYHGADTQKTLLVFTKRQDAWGEAARAFEKDLGRLDGLYKEYHGLVEAYRKDPTLEGRKELNRKWEAIEELSKQLHTSRYHRMETQHAWAMRAREVELFPLETFLGMAEFHALNAARNRPDGKSDFSYEIRYAKPEELAGFEGAWSQVPFDKFVRIEATVRDWKTAQKLVGEMKQNGDLHVVEDFALSPDGKSGRAVVEIWGEKPRRVEIRFGLRGSAAAKPSARLKFLGLDISGLKPGDLVIQDGDAVRSIDFHKKYSHHVRLPQGDLLVKWDPTQGTYTAIWFGKEPLKIQDASGEVRTLEPSRHGRPARTQPLRGDEELAVGDRKIRLLTPKAAADEAVLRAQIREKRRKLEVMRASVERMKTNRDDPAKIAESEKALSEAEADFAKSLRRQRHTAEGIPYAEATNAQIGTPNLPEGPGVAGFKSITDIEAKADKIAKAAPDAERIARYVEHLVNKKGMSRPDAEIQAQRWAEQVIVDARAHQAGRTHIYDTSLPLKPETAHLDKATVDHHGRFANPLNSTEQLLGKMEATLETVKGNPEALDAAAKDAAAMAAARRGFAEAGVKKPKEAQIVEVAAAIRELNLKEATTDNLADGGWSVWVARNQARVLADPALRKTIAEATRFEDFSAFGTVYIEEAKTKKVAELVAGGMPEPKAKALADQMARSGEIFPEGIRWQAALFQKYGEILKRNGVVGSDRFLPAQAEKVMGEALAAIDQIVYDPAARDAATAEFFGKVEEGAKAAAEKALIAEASVHQGDTTISFFDLTKLGDFTVFQQWLALPRVAPSGTPDGIQVSVVPMKPLEASVDGQAIKADRKLQIVAIPNGRELPSQKGLLSALNAMNQAEVAKAEALGLTPKAGEPLKPGQLPRDHFEKLWFGKDNVILPNPMKGGSLLTPKEVSAILTDGVPGAKPLGLFESTDLSKQIDKLPPKSKHLVELMSAPYEVDGILVPPDVKPIVDLIRELGPDKVEAVLARGETSSENLSRLLDRATNENFPAQAAAVRAYLKQASAEEILFLTDTQAMFVDRLANLKLEADGKQISVWELLTTENPYPYLEAVQQIGVPAVRDHVLAAMALREFYHPTRGEAGAEFLAMFGIDRATHDHFPWTPKDNLERAALYVTVAKEKGNLLAGYQKAFPNAAKADIEAFVNDLWKTLRTQDVKDTKLPYTPHGWNHSLTVMNDSARIFDEAGPVREAIVAKLRPKYGDRAEAVARELVKFIGIFHDTGYGCLHPHDKKHVHAERSGQLFKRDFAVHMEKVFGVKANDPLFHEIFLAIERHGADKPGKAEYLRASEKENPFLFVIRMADNLDLTNRRMRQIQLNRPLMAALKEMYLRGQETDFQAMDEAGRKREVEKIQDKHAKAFDQAVKDGRMSRAEADRNKKLLTQLNESTYPHFAGTEQVTGYRLIQDPASGQLTVEIELAGYARGQAIAESGLLVDHPLYQVLRTYIAAQSMTYGVGPDGRGLPIKFTYRETFRATTPDGHDLPIQPDNVRVFRPQEKPLDEPPPAPRGGDDDGVLAAAAGGRAPVGGLIARGEGSGRAQSVSGVLDTGDRSVPGAVLIPHQDGVFGYPFTGYRKLGVVSIDETAGLVVLASASGETLRFQYDPASLPEFVRHLDTGSLVDVLHGGGGSAFPPGFKGQGFSRRTADDSQAALPDPADWTAISERLAQNEIPLSLLAPQVEEINLFVGAQDKIHPQAGLGVVVDDGANRVQTSFWGKLRREGEQWLYYPAELPEARDVRDAFFSPKTPRPDGWIEMGEGDRFSVGFADFQMRDGAPVLTEEVVGLSARLGLHLPADIHAAARGPAVDFVDPVFTHGDQDPQMRIVAGNVDFAWRVPVAHFPADASRGAIAMATTQGKGYSRPNEDAVMTVRGPAGETILLDVDGMGGHGNGDAAALLVTEAFATEIPRSGDSDRAWQLANAAVRRFNGAMEEGLGREVAMAAARQLIADPASQLGGAMDSGSGAVAVQLRIEPPKKAGDPHVAKFSWIGDARGAILRRDAQGGWQWVYRTVDEGLPNQPGKVEPGRDYDWGGGRRTLAMSTHPQANVVTNSLGGDPSARPKGTQDGEVPNPADPTGSSPAGGIFSRGIALRDGDMALLGSDGFWENFGSTKVVLELIRGARNSEEAVQILTAETHYRMEVLSQARSGELPEVIPGLYRFDRPEGILYTDAQGQVRRATTMYIDVGGRVYDSPDAALPVDHYKTDNFSLIGYSHDPLRPTDGPAGRGGVDPRDAGGLGGGGRSSNLAPPAMPPVPSRELIDFSKKMEDRRSGMLRKLSDAGEVQGSAKKFSAAEVQELVWLAAERGMDPQKLPRQVRETFDEYMVAFVAEYGRMFPAELERTTNPFTGEALQKPNPKRPGALIPVYDAQYRYLRSLVNRDLGKPLFGEPSPREREALVNFVSRGMGIEAGSYAEAQKALREEILAGTPRAEKALRGADPNLKYYALLSLRGDDTFLPLADGAQGLNLVRFLGKIGFDQEVGVTVAWNGGAPEYRFLVGGWDHVLQQSVGEYFLIHSHTKYFLNPHSQVMGKGDVTMAAEAGKEHRMSAAVLFSKVDLAGMVQNAEQLAGQGASLPYLYDASSRIYRNYVQHPYGMSEAQIHLDASGRMDRVVVRYAFYDKTGLNHDRLESHRKELGAFLEKYQPKPKVEFLEVPMADLEKGLPAR